MCSEFLVLYPIETQIINQKIGVFESTLIRQHVKLQIGPRGFPQGPSFTC